MRCAGVMALALTAVTVVACGGPDRRDTVNAYLRSANAVQQRWARPFSRANAAYLAFARGKLAPGAAVAALRRAEHDIRAARDALARLRPPADTRALHAKLRRLYDMNLGLAHETAQFAAYEPAAERALAPLDRSNRRLRRELRRAGGPDDQAGALARFAASLAGALQRLRALEVPPVLQPSHGDQLRRLDRARASATQLRRALLEQDAEKVARLLPRLRRSGSSQRARRGLAAQALRAYSRRYRDVTRAYADVRREEARVARSLG